MESRIVNVFVFIILIVAVSITLTPLFIMFRTSVRAQGTLTRAVSEIEVADFEEGLINAFRAPIDKGEDNHQIELKTIAEGEEKILEANILSEVKESILWQTKIEQDVRKFKILNFNIGYPSECVQIELILKDSFGGVTSVFLSDYVKKDVRELQEVAIPLSDFNLEKVDAEHIEFLVFKVEDAKKVKIYFDDVVFRLKKVTFINYIDVFISGPFGRYFFNSAVIALAVTLGNLIFSTMVGYGFARKDFPFKRTMFLLIVGSIMIPPQVLIIPIYILMMSIGWLNTYQALIVPALVLPFNVFLMRQYIDSLPIDLEDAAVVDGANQFQILFRIIVPLARPALAVVGINTFMGAWNTFLYPFILTNRTEMRTLPVGLALYKSLYSVDWVHLMAASSITAIPVIIIFLAFQRNIIASLTAGAVKG